jgi:predicted GNAT superfamily acetyltransferase
MTGANDRSQNGAPIEIRPLRSDAELRQCVDLQRATWGAHYEDLVPPSILTVAQKIGGVAAGAFEPDGRMIGFVFGLAGVRRGRTIHWSDMLAVREDARDRGIGRQLKEYQRTVAKASGAVTMYWTYDPLVARNAHLNFNRLGVTVDEYVEDMYGPSDSDLHRGLGTDRFVVAWPLDEERGRPASGDRATSAADDGEAVVINPDARAMTPSQLAAVDAAPPAAVRVEIPLDIVKLRDSAPGEAARWRGSTRQAFEWALGRGYNVARFIADEPRGRGHYYMTRASAGASR